MMNLKRYLRIWMKLTVNSFLSGLVSRFGAAIFISAKLLRFIFFLIFLQTLFRGITVFSGYTLPQAILFYLTFAVIDTTSQLLFREVYRFRELVVSGDLDLVLTKPMNTLVRVLVGGADPMDLAVLVPYVTFLVFSAYHIPGVSLGSVILYMLLMGNGLLIATGFHIAVLALAVLTTEVDHAIFMYRDISSMARVPVDIYREPLRSILTFVLPVGIMMTFPVKAFLGMMTPIVVIVSCMMGLGALWISLLLWRRALAMYTSASS